MSRGNFVEVMTERIRCGRPVLLTDPNATRFFMTASEAATLVMKSATLGRGGETFWLDMGAAVRMGDLVDRLLEVAADRGWPTVPIETVGLRPGEKLTEQLTTFGFAMRRTTHGRIWVARQRLLSIAQRDAVLSTLRRHVAQDDALGALRTLAATVRDFEPSAHAWATARSERIFRRTPASGAARTA